MWTQRDQVQAYQFLRRRLVSALVSADANHPVSPTKRVVLGVSLGLAVALLIAGAFGVVRLLRPTGPADWRAGGQVVVEKETGARFVLGKDGALHPVLNYASARLLAGGDGRKTAVVPAKKLAGTPRGRTVGIPGAPDSLPETGRLVAGPWTSCSRTSADRPADVEPLSTVLLGRSPVGRQLAADSALPVRTVTGEQFLLTGGHRHRMTDERAATALGYAAVPAVMVARSFLNTVPAGRDLGTITVPDAGSPGPTVGRLETTIGQVLVSSGVDSAGQYHVVRSDGLAVVTEVEASLVLGAEESADAYPDGNPRPVPVPAADIAGAPRSAAESAGYPQRRPAPVLPSSDRIAVCATDFGTDGARIVLGDRLPLDGGAKAIPVAAPGDTAQARTAAEAYVPGGAGALVIEQAAPGTRSGTVYLLTDTGYKYPLPGADAVSSLGYRGAARHRVPATVLALFPTGPSLDPLAAQRTVNG